MSSSSATSITKTATNMIYRHLGPTGLRVSALAFGNWLTHHDTDTQAQADSVIQKCYENGVNYFDTAENYSHGIAETVLGNSLKHHLKVEREELVISTKLFWGGPGVNDVGLSRKHIIEGMNKSLRRLQLDYVDLVFCHRPDYDTPLEETCRAMDHLIQQGKVFYWGTSEWPAQRILEAYGICDRLGLVRPIAEQPQYNMIHRRKFEVEYGVLFDTYKMGSTVWSPLAGGILTGKYMDKVEADSRFAKATGRTKEKFEMLLSPENKSSTDRTLRQLQELASQLLEGTTLAQLALAWVLYNKDVSSAIFGASKVAQVEDNLKAIDVLARIDTKVNEEIERILGNQPETDTDFKTWKPSPPRRR